MNLEHFVKKEIEAKDGARVFYYLAENESLSDLVVLSPPIGIDILAMKKLADKIYEAGKSVLLFSCRPLSTISDYNPRLFGAEQIGEEAKQILSMLQYRNVSFVGWSTGFNVSLAAASHCENTRKVISLGGAIGQLRELYPAKWASHGEALHNLAKTVWEDETKAAMLLDAARNIRASLDETHESSNFIDLLFEEFEKDGEFYRKYQLQVYRIMSDKNVLPMIGNTSFDIDIIGTTEDDLVSIEQLKMTHEYLGERASLKIFSGDHFSLLADEEIHDHIIDKL